MVTEDNIFLLGTAFNDIENPVQPAFFTLSEHVRANMIRVDGRRLGDHSNPLSGVFLDMSWCTRVDKIELEIRWPYYRVLGRRLGDVVRCEIPTSSKHEVR